MNHIQNVVTVWDFDLHSFLNLVAGSKTLSNVDVLCIKMFVIYSSLRLCDLKKIIRASFEIQ